MPSLTRRTTDIANDLVLGAWSIVVGMGVTLKNLALRPRVTQQYPETRPELPRNFRGGFAQVWDEERERPNCVACQICAKACPDRCIHIEGDEGKGKDRKPAVFDLDMSVCMYCGLCVEACPYNALTMTPEFEFAAMAQEQMIVDLETLIATGKRLGIKEVLRPEQVADAAEPAEGA